MNKRNKLNVNNSFLKGKTILITGGTGTFGENFAEKILKIKNVKTHSSPIIINEINLNEEDVESIVIV